MSGDPKLNHRRDVVLEVEDLNVAYTLPRGSLHALRDASFTVARDEVFGLVGESGSGKSTLSMAILKLLTPAAKVHGRRVELNGTDLLKLNNRSMRKLRWAELSYIPQGSMGVLNPVMRIREQFMDVIWDHAPRNQWTALTERVTQVLTGVNLPEEVLDHFPHELSGGMKQRVCIALSILLEPSMIIADEPTSALDVISQRVVLETLATVRQRLGASMILIGHDMALQAQIADRIGIMFAGRFVEIGPVQSVFDNPLHPYTQRLIGAIPSISKREDIRELAQRGLAGADMANELAAESTPLREVTPHHFAAI